MTDEREQFDDGELAAADRLDREIGATLAGGPPPHADPAALWLAAAMRSGAPRELRGAIADRLSAPARRAWGWVRLAAGALALALVAQGVGALFAGEWVAEGIDEPFSSHAFFEGGLAILAVAAAVTAGALRRSWAPVAVVVGVPLGLLLGIGGVPEIGEFAAGAALHLTQGALAVLLLAAWWRARRYTGLPDLEEET